MFVPTFLVLQKLRKARSISKFITTQRDKETITIRILPNISRSIDIQPMKFVQLIEYNMKKLFLEKLNTKCGREASPWPFYKKSKLRISLDQQSEMLYSLFFFEWPSGGVPKYIKTKVLTICFDHIESFLKYEKRSWTSFPTSYSAWFLNKNISHITLY